MFNGPDDKPFWDRPFNGKATKQSPTVDEVWAKAREYFQWMDTHPLQEEQLFHYKGEVTSHAASKMRAYTWDGFATFLGMTKQGVQLWKNGDHGEELKELMDYIGQIIYTQKFEGAADAFCHAPMSWEHMTESTCNLRLLKHEIARPHKK